MKPSPRRLSLSTWSLHRNLGAPEFCNPNNGTNIPNRLRWPKNKAFTLLELPAHVAAFGINTLEICHFHLAARDPAYLATLRTALDAAHMEVFSLLIDAGDIIHPTKCARDTAWIAGWLDVAQALGATHMRVIAGRQKPTDETLEQSFVALKMLAKEAELKGIRLMIENGYELLSTPEAVNGLLDQLEDKVGLCLDFGNWGGATKHANLAKIAARAESCHAKAHFPKAYEMKTEDFRRCLDMLNQVNFSGPYTLVYDAMSGIDEWEGLSQEMAIVKAEIGRAIPG